MITIVERHTDKLGLSRYASVDVDGRRFFVAVEQGKRVRIAFKPRGKNVGHQYVGYVRDDKGKTLWSDRVAKSAGIRTLLKLAGVLQ